jgi:thiamine kinase-like enzyme
VTAEALRLLSRIPQFSQHSFARLEIGWLGGLTNRVYRIDADGEVFVLRIPGAGTERHIDRRRERINMGLAASVGLAPEIVWFDENGGAMLSRFIPNGVALSPESARTSRTLDAVVTTLRRLHHSGQRFEGVLDPFAKMDQYLLVVRESATVEMPEDLAPALNIAETLRREISLFGQPLVPCHVDPSPENIILGGRDGSASLYFIDWEYSAMCDPLWDLADFSMEARLSDAQDRAMLDGYFGPADAEQGRRFRHMKAVVHLIGATWALMQAAVTDRKQDFLADYAENLQLFRKLTAPGQEGN